MHFLFTFCNATPPCTLLNLLPLCTQSPFFLSVSVNFHSITITYTFFSHFQWPPPPFLHLSPHEIPFPPPPHTPRVFSKSPFFVFIPLSVISPNQAQQSDNWGFRAQIYCPPAEGPNIWHPCREYRYPQHATLVYCFIFKSFPKTLNVQTAPPVPGPGLVQRCVVVQKDQLGFGFTVCGETVKLVQNVRAGETCTAEVV